MNSRQLGREGEERAARLLHERGYRVLERNFRTSRGEIDIVALSAERLAFVEVKSWATLGEENLEYAIDRRKQRRIRTASAVYLRRHPELAGKRMGFDVVFLSPRSSGAKHYEDAFGGV
jgi:putative endonuclease